MDVVDWVVEKFIVKVVVGPIEYIVITFIIRIN